jgi:hypothetical protein
MERMLCAQIITQALSKNIYTFQKRDIHGRNTDEIDHSSGRNNGSNLSHENEQNGEEGNNDEKNTSACVEKDSSGELDMSD